MQEPNALPLWAAIPISIALAALLAWWITDRVRSWRAKPLHQREMEARASTADGVALFVTAVLFFVVAGFLVFLADKFGIDIFADERWFRGLCAAAIFLVLGPIPMAYRWVSSMLSGNGDASYRPEEERMSGD